MRIVIQYGYFPLMFIGFNSAIIFLNSNGYPWYATLPLMGLALLVSFTMEALLPYNSDWNHSKSDKVKDIMHFVVNETMNYAGILLLPLLSSLALFPTLWPHTWPFVLQVLLAVVVFDVGTTLFHYLSHKKAFFWRFHAVHHVPQRLYGFNGIMKHPVFQLMDSVVAFGPLMIAGIPQEVAFTLVSCIFLQLLIQHSNVDFKTGALKHFLATAEVHRFHHLRGRAGDVNFALFFSILDRFLGTAYYENRTTPLTEHSVGIDDEHFPDDYLGQLVSAFKKSTPTQKIIIVEAGLKVDIE